ncbi:MAG: NAD(P)-binding domain-containing protein [Bacteroidetes bacterium]|nr:NAD(P)-binding domain-containing protein [Bacteroidota bacterium]
METKSIGFIGGGRITKIFLVAFSNAAIPTDHVRVFDPQESVLKGLKSQFPNIETSSDDMTRSVGADMVLLAVHPPVMMETLAKIKGLLNPEAIVISLAPKFTIRKMTDELGGFPNIARINPSASSIINSGLNPVCFSTTMTEERRIEVIELMEPLGILPEVEEHKIEAYAMISAMGHTYFWPQIQKLQELAISFGMDESEAKSVIAEMLNGTAETLFNSGLSYEEVVDLVPVKPLGEVESTIIGYYEQYLSALFNKIKA